VPEDLLPAAVLTAGGLVALVLISNFGAMTNRSAV